MAETFSGEWVLECFTNLHLAHIPYRFTIQGSQASDGVYPLEISTPPLTVAGPRWSVAFEWFDPRDGRQSWFPGALRRTGASFTVADSLVVILDPMSSPGQEPFPGLNGMMLALPWSPIRMRCRNLDPDLRPWLLPFANPYDFTRPARKTPRPLRPPVR